MKQSTAIWQHEGNLVFKLRETGKVKFNADRTAVVPELENEFTISIHRTADKTETGPANNMKEILLASLITQLLNNTEGM